MFERELTTLQGQQSGERIAVVEVSFPASAQKTNYIELRVEHQVGDLGWVVHRRIPIASPDVCELRSALALFAASSATACCTAKVVPLADYRESQIA